jgi:hypothetical protein
MFNGESNVVVELGNTSFVYITWWEKNMQNIYDNNSLISNSNIFTRRASEML